MKPLSHIAEQVNESSTLAMDALYKQMKADGIDVLGFAAGEPDFPTPDRIKLAAIEAIINNDTKYTPATGTLVLKKAICQRLKADCSVEYQPSQIIVSSGAKHCIYLVMQSLVNEGDEVIIPTPAWVSYSEMTKMAGGVPVFIPCGEAEHFKLTPERLEAAITDKTKCIFFNNPSNPTGMVYTAEELRALADVCLKHDLYIIADEIYYKLLYDGVTFTSIAALSPEIKAHTILINGVSKSYAMTGWRIGYLAAEPEVVKVISRYVSHSTGNPSAPAQAAAVEALSGPQEDVEIMRQAFEKRRSAMVKGLNALPGISCLTPHGAFYVMMNISEWIGKTLFGEVIQDENHFASLLLTKGKVCLVPSTGFGVPGFLRWSYATSMENIKAGIDRLEQFLIEGDAFGSRSEK